VQQPAWAKAHPTGSELIIDDLRLMIVRFRVVRGFMAVTGEIAAPAFARAGLLRSWQ